MASLFLTSTQDEYLSGSDYAADGVGHEEGVESVRRIPGPYWGLNIGHPSHSLANVP
jgi:hypothetical protein